MHKFYSFAILIAFISLVSCKEDSKTIPTPIEIEDEWPNFVDTGANIVAYKVNGKVRVNKNISTIYPNYWVASCLYQANDSIKSFYFEANRVADDLFQSVYINISDVKDTGYYKINGDLGVNLAVYVEGVSPNNIKNYPTNNNDSGYIYISKIDFSNRIISGKFEFIGKDFFGSEKKKITNGQFDLKYFR